MSTILEVCHFSPKPCWTKLFSRPLDASRKRPVNGASIVRRLSLWLTRFTCILIMDLWFPWPFLILKRKMKCACTFGSRSPATFSESTELSCACPIFRREKFADPTRYFEFSFRSFSWSKLYSLTIMPFSQPTCKNVCVQHLFKRAPSRTHVLAVFQSYLSVRPKEAKWAKLSSLFFSSSPLHPLYLTINIIPYQTR